MIVKVLCSTFSCLFQNFAVLFFGSTFYACSSTLQYFLMLVQVLFGTWMDFGTLGGLAVFIKLQYYFTEWAFSLFCSTFYTYSILGILVDNDVIFHRSEQFVSIVIHSLIEILLSRLSLYCVNNFNICLISVSNLSIPCIWTVHNCNSVLLLDCN